MSSDKQPPDSPKSQPASDASGAGFPIDEPTTPKPFDPTIPPSKDNPVPSGKSGAAALESWGMEGEKDAGPLDPWRNIRKNTWQPGQTGNPKGRPKGAKSYVVALREAAALPANDLPFAKLAAQTLGIPEEAIADLEIQHVIALAHLYQTLLGSGVHLSMFIDRMDGKVPETINVNSAGDAAQAVRDALAGIDRAEESEATHESINAPTSVEDATSQSPDPD